MEWAYSYFELTVLLLKNFHWFIDLSSSNFSFCCRINCWVAYYNWNSLFWFAINRFFSFSNWSSYFLKIIIFLSKVSLISFSSCWSLVTKHDVGLKVVYLFFCSFFPNCCYYLSVFRYYIFKCFWIFALI